MSPRSRVGLTKEQVRRIVLSKLRIVYRDWHSEQGPFWHPSAEGWTPAERRAII
jgi:hypothetical protein